MYWDIELDDQSLQDLYAWIDQIPLSRPKKHIDKDFADGVMVAELIKHYFPSWVDLHNYVAANNTEQKLINWGLLNRKVLAQLDLNVPESIIRGICLGRAGLVELFLHNLRSKIDDYLSGRETQARAPRQRALPREGRARDSDVAISRQRLRPSPPPHPEQNSSGYPRNESRSTKQGGHTAKKTTSMQNLSTDMVNRAHYDEKERECREKDQQIQILQAKIRRLEHLLQLKDVRVDGLADQLGQTKQTKGVLKVQGGKQNGQQQTQVPLKGRK